MQELSFMIHNSMNLAQEAFKVLMKLNASSEKGIIAIARVYFM